MDNKILELINVSKSYKQGSGKVQALHSTSFYICSGEVSALTGASGSGKSTILHIAGLLDAADKGKIIIDGLDVSSLKEKEKADLRCNSIGFVYQFHHLMPDFTVVENIMMPAIIAQKGANKEVKERAKCLMQTMDILSKANRYPDQLSGGEQQRVAIARALINNPKIVLADEPTGNLDHKNAIEVFKLMMSLAKQDGTAFLIATHNLELAEQSDKVFNLKDGHIRRTK